MFKFDVLPNSPSIYTEQLRIRSYHTDVHRVLTIPKLCSFFQEVAGNHTVACGLGWEMMQEQSIFWVLSRLKIEVTRMPAWQELITIRTWSNGLTGLQAIRFFEVLDSDGQELVRAISMWVMMNTQTRRLVRPGEYMKDFPLCDDRLFEADPEKLPALENPEAFPAFAVSYTETDMNRHMNNVSYIDRVLNTFEFDFLKAHRMTHFEINFLKEARPGEEIGVNRQQTGPLNYLSNLATPNGTSEFVRTAMVFEEIK